MPLILATSNTTFNIANYRLGLLRHLASQGFDVAVAAPEDEYTEAVSREFPFQRITSLNSHGSNPVHDLALFAEYLALVRKLRPDALLSWTIKPNAYAGLASRVLGIGNFVPMVTGVGEMFKNPLIARFSTELQKTAYRGIGKVLFQNNTDRDEFLAKGIIAKDQALVVPGSGIDLDRFRPSPLPETVHFLMVSRLLRSKGVGVFCRAAAELCSSLLAAGQPRHLLPTFTLVGKPSAGANAFPAGDIASLSRGHVQYAGETADIRPFMQKATALVLPSSYREGIPRVLIEGCATGRIIIASNAPGCRETVQGNGFLVDLADLKEGLLGAMAAVVAMSAAQRQLLADRSRLLAEQRFAQSVIFRAYEELLSPLLVPCRLPVRSAAPSETAVLSRDPATVTVAELSRPQLPVVEHPRRTGRRVA